MAEGEVVEVTGLDLGAGDHHVVAVCLALDGERRVEQPDMPGRPLVLRRVEVQQRRVRRPLRREALAVHDEVERPEVDVRVVRIQHRHEIRAHRSGECRQVVSAVDRRAIEDVVRARRDHDPDPSVDEALQLRGRALDGSSRLDVRIEQVARDQHEVDLLGEGEVDRRHECRELPLPLRRGPISQVRVPRPKVDVGGVEQSQHALRAPSTNAPRHPGFSLASEAPPIAPRSPARTVSDHCDRYVGTASIGCMTHDGRLE